MCELFPIENKERTKISMKLRTEKKIQEKATLNKPKLETGKELRKRKESKTKENTENKEPKQTERRNLHNIVNKIRL